MLILTLFYAGIFITVFMLWTTLFYWYEGAGSQNSDLAPLKAGWFNFLYLWLLSLSSLLMIFAAHVIHLVYRLLPTPKTLPIAGQATPPVLLVHGLYHNASGWAFLRRYLEKTGFPHVSTFNYSSYNTDIDRILFLFDEAITQLAHRFPGRKPVLIGHSLGGLIIRAWLADPANQNRAAGAITLGTPHRGSRMAALAVGNLGRSLLPDNPFFAQLRAKESPAGIPCVALVTEGDNMVLPLENLVPLTPGWEMRKTPLTCHLGLLFTPSVMRMLVWELTRMLPDSSDSIAEPHEKGGQNINAVPGTPDRAHP